MKNKEFETSSGNVFKDLGFANPEERLAKAKLAIQINLLVEKKKLTKRGVAKLFGVNQMLASDLSRGRLADFSLGMLFNFLNILGQDITIRVTPKTRTKKKPQIDVSCDRIIKRKPVSNDAMVSRSAMLARKKK